MRHESRASIAEQGHLLQSECQILHDLIQRVGQGSYDKQTIEEIDRDFGSSNLAVTTVGSENHDSGKVAFKRSVKVDEEFIV